MKREIKFRGLIEYISSGKREWVFYGVGSKPSLSGAIWIVEDEQFTGLLDSKVVEVYEGDVIRGGEKDEPCKVIWQDVAGRWIAFGESYKIYATKFNMFEVIGTIHDAEYKELAK